MAEHPRGIKRAQESGDSGPPSKRLRPSEQNIHKGDLTIDSHADYVDAKQYTRIEGNFTLRWCGTDNLTFPRLETVTGRMRMIECTFSKLPAFQSLTQAGTLELNSLPNLKTMEGFESLRVAEREVVLDNLPKLQSLKGLTGLTVTGALMLSALLQIVDFKGLDRLEEVRELEIINCANMRSFNGLDNLRIIRKSLFLHFSPIQYIAALAGVSPRSNFLVEVPRPLRSRSLLDDITTGRDLVDLALRQFVLLKPPRGVAADDRATAASAAHALNVRPEMVLALRSEAFRLRKTTASSAGIVGVRAMGPVNLAPRHFEPYPDVYKICALAFVTPEGEVDRPAADAWDARSNRNASHIEVTCDAYAAILKAAEAACFDGPFFRMCRGRRV
jgi:hypothetical protein